MKRQSAGHTKRRRNPRVTLAIALGAGFLVLGGVALATPGSRNPLGTGARAWDAG